MLNHAASNNQSQMFINLKKNLVREKKPTDGKPVDMSLAMRVTYDVIDFEFLFPGRPAEEFKLSQSEIEDARHSEIAEKLKGAIDVIDSTDKTLHVFTQKLPDIKSLRAPCYVCLEEKYFVTLYFANTDEGVFQELKPTDHNRETYNATVSAYLNKKDLSFLPSLLSLVKTPWSLSNRTHGDAKKGPGFTLSVNGKLCTAQYQRLRKLLPYIQEFFDIPTQPIAEFQKFIDNCQHDFLGRRAYIVSQFKTNPKEASAEIIRFLQSDQDTRELREDYVMSIANWMVDAGQFEAAVLILAAFPQSSGYFFEANERIVEILEQHEHALGQTKHNEYLAVAKLKMAIKKQDRNLDCDAAAAFFAMLGKDNMPTFSPPNDGTPLTVAMLMHVGRYVQQERAPRQEFVTKQYNIAYENAGNTGRGNDSVSNTERWVRQEHNRKK